LIENRLARELLTVHPPDKLFVKQLSRPSPLRKLTLTDGTGLCPDPGHVSFGLHL